MVGLESGLEAVVAHLKMSEKPNICLSVVFPRIFLGGAKFRARGFAARLFVFARFARKKIKTSGT